MMAQDYEARALRLEGVAREADYAVRAPEMYKTEQTRSGASGPHLRRPTNWPPCGSGRAGISTRHVAAESN